MCGKRVLEVGGQRLEVRRKENPAPLQRQQECGTRLAPCWRIGDRNAWTAQHFTYDLAARLANRVQLKCDGHRAYLGAADLAFGTQIDYAMLMKLYNNDRPGARQDAETRYSPAECIGCRETVITGKPSPRHISTSYAERQNLTVRMKIRRFTRLANAFSKKLDNHRWAIALYFMHYSFCRIHQTLRVTPAMEAGIANHVWTIEEILALMDSANPQKTVLGGVA